MADIAELLRSRVLILLDFDGPVCAAFGPTEATRVATALDGFARSRRLHLAQGANPNDPLALLRAIAVERPDLAAEADTELRRLERHAIAHATPTPAAGDFIRTAAATGHTVAIASNNATEAIQDYLRAHKLSAFVAAIEGRPPGEPTRMKPEPWVLEQALARTHHRPEQAVMIGDSATDVQAANEVGIPCIGYANKPGKEARLRGAGAQAVATSVEELRAALLEE
jgi:N-acetyl-D-muramate 6-phosphate phosphatase